MKIKDLLTKNAEVLDPDSTVEQAAQAMADADVGSLPVLRRGKVVGILTDRDIVVRVVAEGLAPAETRAEQVMTTDVVHCSEEDEVEEAARLMGAGQIRRLVVLDEEGDFAGVVTLGDLALRASETADEVLQKVSRPSQELTQGIYAGGPAGADHAAEDSGGVVLVKDELAAIEIYKEILETVHDGKAGDELRRIENEHEEAARLLRENFGRLGIDAPRKPGAARAWNDAKKRTSGFTEDKAAIRILMDGETREVEDYERALQDETLDSRLKTLIAANLLPRTRAHVSVLNRFLGDAPVT